MKKDDLKAKFKTLRELKAKNRVKYAWQDAVLVIIEDLALPRYVQTQKNKKPLDVRAILMRHGRENLPVLKRRMAAVKEQGLAADQAFLYYLGIVENESKL